jgi:hypothetical protein
MPSREGVTLEGHSRVGAALVVGRHLQVTLQQQRPHQTCSERNVGGVALSPPLVDLHDLHPGARSGHPPKRNPKSCIQIA